MSFGLDAVSSADVFTLNLVAIVVLLQSNKNLATLQCGEI